MNTREHETVKMRGSADVSYLGRTVDEMIWEFMEQEEIPGLTLAIVQAPYIPRVVGYGLSDPKQRRLASANTLWPAGPISQAFAAVAVMQLHEDGKLQMDDKASQFIPQLPETWQEITILQLLRHASGLSDYRASEGFDLSRQWSFQNLVDLVAEEPLQFVPGSSVIQSATNFLLLTEVVERVSGKSYHDFVTERQIEYLGLRHTGFCEDLKDFTYEDISLTENILSYLKRWNVHRPDRACRQLR